MSSTRSNAAHAMTSTVAELYCFHDLSVSGKRRKIAALLKNDSFACLDEFR
jgi:hypothetical protein